jgi:AcrR family transcriptional regulator
MASFAASAMAGRRVDSKHKSQSVQQAVDPRPERTRALIAQALAALLGRRPYAQIRVSDITRKAGVGRVTFYAHFASKDALLSNELAHVVQTTLLPLPGAACLVDCTGLFAHMHHAPDIYRALMVGASRLTAEHLVQNALEGRVREIVASASAASAHTAVPPALVARFVASTLLSLVAWSLEQTKPPDAAHLQRLFGSLVGRALQPGDTPNDALAPG